MEPVFASDLCNRQVAVIGQARNDRRDVVLFDMLYQRGGVRRIKRVAREIAEIVCCDNFIGRTRLAIDQLHAVVATLREQPGDEGADFASSQYQDLFHGGPREG